ncbi:MAG TPA: alkaline phosphatase D family protein [Anaerolineales bacterium]
MDSIFRHGVASGDPLQDRVILWTRLTVPSDQDQQLAWAVAMDPDFTEVVKSGTGVACVDDDHTVRVDVTGLRPGNRYFYRFHALGQTSPVGRTSTLPPDTVRHVRFAQVSCAKFNAGFFNGYARIAARAERNELDFVMHLGDYIYEVADVPPSGQAAGAGIGRPFDPLHECKTLDDYRRRYNQYHQDPDLQRLHASLPIISTVDDHEVADGAWRGGADLHDEARDGHWGERLRNALRARLEWLPIRLPDRADPLRVYRSLHLGRLADLFLINTRTHRDKAAPPPEMFDPNRTALGLPQREWLFDEFDRSTATWRILGNPSILGTTWKTGLPESARAALLATRLIAADGLGPDIDQWDGYPAERYLLMRKMRDHRFGNFVVLSGDIHSSLAQELRMDAFDTSEAPVAVECVNASISSQNFDEKMNWEPRTRSIEYEQELLGLFPGMKYIDLDSHGYNLVDLTPERVEVEWWNVDTILKPSDGEQLGRAFRIDSGKPGLVPVS